MLPIVSVTVNCLLFQGSFQDALDQLKNKLLVDLLGWGILELFVLADTIQIIADINVIHHEL